MKFTSIFLLAVLPCLILPCHQTMADEKQEKVQKLIKEIEARPALLTAKPLEPAHGDDELHKLFKAQYNDRVTIALTDFWAFAHKGQESEGGPCMVSLERLLRVGLQVYDSGEEHSNFLKQFDDVCKKVELIIEFHALVDDKPDAIELNRHGLHDLQTEVQIQRLKDKK